MPLPGKMRKKKPTPKSPLKSRVALASLGCSKNLVDSEILLAHLVSSGFTITASAEDADAVIVNTCGFIAPAVEESEEVIAKFARSRKCGRLKRLAVVGCLAERSGRVLLEKFPEIDILIGALTPERLLRLSRALALDESAGGVEPYRVDWTSRLRLTPSHYSYLRIADGCDNQCGYCMIPAIRGPYRSRPMKELIEEANLLANSGVVELNIIAQDTTNYGRDLPEARPTIVDLLRALAEIDKLHWIRLLYTHPAHFSDELVSFLSLGGKVIPYVDLPLQHISDRILSAMGRGVTKSEIKRLIGKIRRTIPRAVLRTTFIVGLPGETEAEFAELLEFVEETRFERLGSFVYSPEAATPASAMSGQVPEEVKLERRDRLMRLEQSMLFEMNLRVVGKVVTALVDSGPDDEGLFRARTYADAPEVDTEVLVSGKNVSPGSFVRARVTGQKGYDLLAEKVA